MPKVHQQQTATILAISGRRMTVDFNGNTADYQINRTAKITLNDKPARLADLENGDEVSLGGVSRKGVDQVKATRSEEQPLPKAITPNTTNHFPPRSGDESQALKTKGDEEKAKQQLREGADLGNKPEPHQPEDTRKASDPDLPTGDKSTDDDTKASSGNKPFSPTVPHPRKRTDR